MTDNTNELLYLMRCGSVLARDELYKNYYEVVKKITINHHFYPDRLENDDLAQQGMICFHYAIYSYRDDKQANLNTYIAYCVIRCLQNEFKRYHHMEASYKTISFDARISYDDNRRVGDVFVSEGCVRYAPDRVYATNSELEAISDYSKAYLNQREQEVFNLMARGYKRQEIADILGIDIKNVYNTLYRSLQKIRRKKKG